MTARAINSIWRIAAWALAAYWIVLFSGTHIPAPPEVMLHIHDKVLHFNGFWVLGFLLTMVMTLRRGATARRMAIVMAVVAVYGAVDEWTQPLVNRDCDFYDWLADITGGAGGVLLGVAIVALLRRRLKPSPTACEPPKAERPAATDRIL